MPVTSPTTRLVDATTGETTAGRALVAAVEEARAWSAATPPGATFLLMPTSVGSVMTYLGARTAGRAVALLDPQLGAPALTALVRRYRPSAVIGPVDTRVAPPPGYEERTGGLMTAVGRAWVRADGNAALVHPDLAILLPTSGSTGDPKLVRLSRSAVDANSAAIVETLGIRSEAVTMTTLPLFYSYGMSVLNTYARVGATVVVTTQTMLERGFWAAVDSYGVTSLALVPTQYELLRRLRFDATRHSSLDTLTQAGGRMDPALVLEAHGWMREAGGRLFVMYGQTEAGPRLTTLPAEALPDAVGSVGPALPGGRLSVRTDDGVETSEPGVRGEVVYRGPNVMMGYALEAADLGRGDDLGGMLTTGDIGRLDGRGYLTLEGRASRVGKVFGVRINLDDIERLVQKSSGERVAATATDDGIVIWTDGDLDSIAGHVRELAAGLRLHWKAFRVLRLAKLPLLPSGKVDYRGLEVGG